MYKIMLADDEGIVIDALKFIIEKNFEDECVVEYAKTGRNVIELSETFSPDIAFMDIQMPGINGIEAMKEIRKHNSSVIFIVVSAYDKFDYAKEAINLGVMEYINKPILHDKIVEILRRAMGIIDQERKKRRNDLMIREKLENVVPVIESGLIYSILFQEHFEEDVENYKQLLGINVDYGYMLSLVCGENQENNHMTNAVGSGIRIQSNYRDIRDSIKDYFPGIIGPVMANKIAVLIPYDEKLMDYDARIELIEKARQLARKLKSRMDLQFRIGIGSVKNINQAVESYNEALTALLHARGSVAHVEDLPLGCDYEEDYPIELEKKLFDAVGRGDVAEGNEIAKKFFDWMQEKHGEYRDDIKLKALEFVLWSEHIAYESGGMVYKFRSRSEYLEVLNQMQGNDEIRRWFLEKTWEACQNVKGKKQETSSTIIDKAKEYIEKQYHKDISLDEVSKEVDISPYYFSKLFKEETGENFVKYVTNIRMNKAKELLNNTDMSMKEIGLRIGYADPNYFSRIFKKNIGVTPTEYKEGRG
ncbi:response regulator [Konateibacter massiliensis]|uniref:response regulator n=1 Tax=Konateibacter massiliensis TaxID=2002841 RepID=UPI000C1450F6|nr:response regulator [Konateibacter massiliensis]